jgi:hypothetical protein
VIGQGHVRVLHRLRPWAVEARGPTGSGFRDSVPCRTAGGSRPGWVSRRTGRAAPRSARRAGPARGTAPWRPG